MDPRLIESLPDVPKDRTPYEIARDTQTGSIHFRRPGPRQGLTLAIILAPVTSEISPAGELVIFHKNSLMPEEAEGLTVGFSGSPPERGLLFRFASAEDALKKAREGDPSLTIYRDFESEANQ
ncbi:MAG TPA: hypothetical protein VGZ22_29810 [Isosphaeraceae bacterium]|nr:hypothetical protein [Isosphaeraceae bacterium]